MGTAAIIQLALQVLTQLPALILAAEGAFGHKSGTGAQKKQFVIGAVDAALAVAADAGVDELKDQNRREAIKTVAANVTDSVVSSLNAVDAWKKAPSVPLPTAPVAAPKA